MEKNSALTDLAKQHERIVEMQAYLGPLVQTARLEGASWSEIGAQLGISKQSAHERYGQTAASSSPGTRKA